MMIQGSCDITALAIFRIINLVYETIFFIAPLQLKQCALREE